QRPSGQAPLRYVHAATSPSRLWAGPRGARERRAPGEASQNQHTSRPAARPDPKTPPICPLRAGYTHCCDFRCRSPTATWVARVARSEFAGRQLSTTGPGPSGTFFLTMVGTFHGESRSANTPGAHNRAIVSALMEAASVDWLAAAELHMRAA